MMKWTLAALVAASPAFAQELTEQEALACGNALLMLSQVNVMNVPMDNPVAPQLLEMIVDMPTKAGPIRIHLKGFEGAGEPISTVTCDVKAWEAEAERKTEEGE